MLFGCGVCVDSIANAKRAQSDDVAHSLNIQSQGTRFVSSSPKFLTGWKT